MDLVYILFISMGGLLIIISAIMFITNDSDLTRLSFRVFMVGLIIILVSLVVWGFLNPSATAPQDNKWL